MATERIFIDWKEHALVGAARFISERFGSQSEIMPADYSKLVVVTPGSRAARRLQELLTVATPQAAIISPKFVTVSGLADLLIGNGDKEVIADDLERLAAWTAALRGTPTEFIARWLPHPPKGEGAAAWLPHARECDRITIELSAAGVTFNDAANMAEEIGSDSSAERWRVLAAIHKDYELALDAVGLIDESRRRINYLKKTGSTSCITDLTIVLVATIDLIPIVRSLIKRSSVPTIALIHAPEHEADKFDELGCVVTKAWESRAFALPDIQLIVASDTQDEADMIAEILRDVDNPGEVTIGAANPRNAALIAAACDERGLKLHDSQGIPFSRSELYSGLKCLLRYLQSRSSDDFYELLHHNLFIRAVITTDNSIQDPLSVIDEFYRRHLPLRIEKSGIAGLSKNSTAVRGLQTILIALQKIIPTEFGETASSVSKKSLAEWSKHLIELVSSLQNFIPDTDWKLRESEVFDTISDFCTEIVDLKTESLGQINAIEALLFMLESLQNCRIPSTSSTNSIEMVGWLELHLDDAPLLIVADMNDGAVPETVISDPLLPDRLRAKLGLTDNARRYARDSYALAAILATRPQSIFCAARRSAEGEPLLLSRLLLGGTSQELATTILKYYGADSNENAQNALRKQVSTNAHVTPRPLSPPEKVAPITQVSVTGFSDYLRCPYRFYLKHIEQLLEVHDDFEELDSAGFGSLLHTVLQEFAQGAARESTDPNEIEKALREILVKVALKQFGDPKLNAIQPAARIQIQQLSGRLAPFAKAQARWANEGWRIKYTEYECDPKLAVLPLPGDSTPMSLRGRIDRIDYNERTGNWAVLDYKSGDLAKSPEQLHRRRIRGKEDQAWFNLQLPLYHHILRGAGFTGQIDLGIFRVGSATNDIGISTAEWTVEDLEIAIRCAIEVAESIRAQRFWPPNGDQLDFDEFEALVALANRRLYAGGGR